MSPEANRGQTRRDRQMGAPWKSWVWAQVFLWERLELEPQGWVRMTMPSRLSPRCAPHGDLLSVGLS